MEKTLKITDLDYSFKPHPITCNLLIKNGLDAVKQSVKTLLLLNLFEKRFSPLSTNIKIRLFENFNLVLENSLISSIKDILRDFEPRIRVEDVEILFDERNDQNMIINVTFTVIGKESQSEEITLVVSRSR